MLYIDPAWVDTYEGNFRHLYQQKQSVLSPYIQRGTMEGKKKRFTYIGKADMVERQGKNTDTKWQDLEFYNRWISRRVFDYALLIDEFDDIKSALTDPTSSAIQGALMAANRRKDRVIVEAFGATAYTGENADVAVPFPSENIIDVQLGSASTKENQPLNLAKLKELAARMDEGDVPETDRRILVCTQRQLNSLLDDEHVSSADYNSVKALVSGTIDSFYGFKFVKYNGLPLENDVRTCWAFSSSSMQLAVSLDTRIKGPVEIPQKHFQPGFEVTMALDAVRLYDAGVYQVPCKEVK